MAERDTEDAVLEAHFAAARRGGATLPAGLATRMLADAAAVQDQPATGAARRRVRDGLVQPLLRALGGWPAMGGLAAACAAGVWLGVSPPDFLPDPVGLVMQAGADVNLLDGSALSSVLAEDS